MPREKDLWDLQYFLTYCSASKHLGSVPLRDTEREIK